MNQLKLSACVIFAAFALVSGAAQAQTRMWVRGTITSLEGNVLMVKSRDGRDLKINLAPNFGVRAAKAITVADIKPGDFVGPASIKRADGALVAISLQLFSPDRRAAIREGHTPWDLEPGSMMTNSTLASVAQVGNERVLTLSYGNDSQKVILPEGIPMFTTVPADRSLLVAGAYVSFPAQVGADGTLSAAGVAVSKDGVRPAN